MAHSDHAVCKGICASMEAMPKSAPKRLLTLIDLIRTNISSLRSIFPTEDECVAWALSLYDLHIAPIDIPWVSDSLEKIMDDAAKKVVDQVVRGLYPG